MTANTKKPKIMVENISCILPEQSQLGGLFLGNVYGAQNAAILKQYGIRAVLTSSIQTDIEYNHKDIPFHLRISAHDKQNYNIKQHINDCINFIEQSRKLTNVYVHCFAGVSRSAAIVCAYIMWKLRWNFQTTIAFVKAKRIVANPNEGFLRQLMEMQSMLMGLQDEEQNADGYADNMPQNYSLNYNQLQKRAEVPQLMAQTYYKQTEGQGSTEIYNSTTNSFNSTFPVGQFNRLSLEQQYMNNTSSSQYTTAAYNDSKYDSKLQSNEPNFSLYHTPKLSNNQYFKPSEYPQNYHNQFQSFTSSNSNNFGHNLYYVDTQKISKQQKSIEKITNDKFSQKTTSTQNGHNDKFSYLQNFFPQNHSKNVAQKPKNRINSAISSNNPDNNNLGAKYSQQKPGSTKKSLKKLQNTQVSTNGHGQKLAPNYHIPKPTSNLSNNNNHQLILGGGKKPQTPMNNHIHYNHNSIPIPNIKQNSLNKTYSINNTNNNERHLKKQTQENSNFYHTLNGVHSANKKLTDVYSNAYSNSINGHDRNQSINLQNNDVMMMVSPRNLNQQQKSKNSAYSFSQQNQIEKQQKISMQQTIHNASLNNLNYSQPQRFDFRTITSSQQLSTTYSNNPKLATKNNNLNKSSSRLVKPKDLPGYKNY